MSDQTLIALSREVAALTHERDRLQQENEKLNNCAAEREAYRKAWMESEAQRQHLAAQVQALEAAASWQDIATAAKSSQHILVWCPENLCSYSVTWHQPYKVNDVGYWCIWGANTVTRLQRIPTLWMPAPPAASRRSPEQETP